MPLLASQMQQVSTVSHYWAVLEAYSSCVVADDNVWKMSLSSWSCWTDWRISLESKCFDTFAPRGAVMCSACVPSLFENFLYSFRYDCSTPDECNDSGDRKVLKAKVGIGEA